MSGMHDRVDNIIHLCAQGHRGNLLALPRFCMDHHKYASVRAISSCFRVLAPPTRSLVAMEESLYIVVIWSTNNRLKKLYTILLNRYCLEKIVESGGCDTRSHKPPSS
jgi:hypothetical protein